MLAFLSATTAFAGSFVVSHGPVSLDERTVEVRVTNTGDAPVLVGTAVLAADGSATDAVTARPAELTIPAGATRTVALQRSVSPAEVERAFTLVVEERHLGLARVEAPVYVPAAETVSSGRVEASVSEGTLVVRVANTGNTRFDRHSVRVAGDGFDALRQAGVVRAGEEARHAFWIPAEACDAQHLAVRVVTDKGTLDAVVPVRAADCLRPTSAVAATD